MLRSSGNERTGRETEQPLPQIRLSAYISEPLGHGTLCFCNCGLSNLCDILGRLEDVISVAEIKGIRPLEMVVTGQPEI